jgi:hypothetical protein
VRPSGYEANGGVMGSLKSVTCSACHPIIPPIQGTIWAHPIRPGHDLGTSESMSIFPKVTQAALTKILPGEEDRFGK